MENRPNGPSFRKNRDYNCPKPLFPPRKTKNLPPPSTRPPFHLTHTGLRVEGAPNTPPPRQRKRSHAGRPRWVFRQPDGHSSGSLNDQKVEGWKEGGRTPSTHNPLIYYDLR
jgi:hypothetical protein